MPSRRHENVPAGTGGVSVVVRNNDIEKAIRILRKKVNQENILRDLQEKEYYEKPSVKKRRRQAEAVNRWRKMEKMIKDEI